MRGCPGIAPRSSSSRLGLVAAVSETDSPSQLSPLVSHEHVDEQALDVAAVVGEIDRLPHAPTAASVSLARRALGRWASAARCSSAVPCRCSAPSRLVTSPAWRQPRQGVGDRWPLRADEPSEQPVRERQRETDASGLDPPPAAGQVPEQQRDPHLQARLRGDRALDVEVGRARAGPREQGMRDLRPGLDALRERVVEQGQPRGHQGVPGRAALEQVVGARGDGLQDVAVADDLRGGAVAHAHVDAEHAVEDEHARPMADLGEAAREVAGARGRGEHDGRHDLPRDEAHAQVELLGQIVVEVEQIAVGRGWQRVDAGQFAQRRPLLRALR